MEHDRIASLRDHYFLNLTENSTHVYCLKRLFLLQNIFIYVSFKVKTDFIIEIYFKTSKA